MPSQQRFSSSSNSHSETSSEDDSGVPSGLFGGLSSGRSAGDEASAVSAALSAGRKGRNGNSKKGGSSPKNTDGGKLVGTCQNLEKPYFRLTTFPRAQDVRPLSVLRLSLRHTKAKYIKEEDFEWANEQLKSIRQDMTVQNLREEFVLEVYETHARLLLEHGDLNEFHQCQCMIQTLTGMNGKSDIEGPQVEREPWENVDTSNILLKQSAEISDEFKAYCLLYALVQNQPNLTSNFDDSPLSSQLHAQSVVLSVIHSDYRTFFRLYKNAPNLSAYLMDFLVLRVRQSAMERMLAAYRPTLSMEQIRETLAFPDLEAARLFLKNNQNVLYVKEDESPKFWIDCKASSLRQNKKKKKKAVKR